MPTEQDNNMKTTLCRKIVKWLLVYDFIVIWSVASNQIQDKYLFRKTLNFILGSCEGVNRRRLLSNLIGKEPKLWPRLQSRNIILYSRSLNIFVKEKLKVFFFLFIKLKCLPIVELKYFFMNSSSSGIWSNILMDTF